MHSALIVGTHAWDKYLTPMIDSASAFCDENNIRYKVVRVPGLFESPLLVKKALHGDLYTFAIVLGYIGLDNSQHSLCIGQSVYNHLLEISLMHEKPVFTGIVGPGATENDAKCYGPEFGKGAAAASVQFFDALSSALK